MTQIEVYTERLKRMVGRVLNGNGNTELLPADRRRSRQASAQKWS